MKRFFISCMLLLICSNMLYAQQSNLSKDDKLKISLQNALLLTGCYTKQYREAFEDARIGELMGNISELFYKLLHHYKMSDMIGHCVTLIREDYESAWGETSLSNYRNIIGYVEIKKLDNRYECKVYNDVNNDRSYKLTITFDESPTGLFHYEWVFPRATYYADTPHNYAIKLSRSADGALRLYAYSKNGGLLTEPTPVTLDGYGRVVQFLRPSDNISVLEYAKNTVSYYADNTIKSRTAQRVFLGKHEVITVYMDYIVNGNVLRYETHNSYSGKDTPVYYKQGRIENIDYLDYYYYDKSSLSGIKMVCRYYLVDKSDLLYAGDPVSIHLTNSEKEVAQRKIAEKEEKERIEREKIDARVAAEKKKAAREALQKPIPIPSLAPSRK